MIFPMLFSLIHCRAALVCRNAFFSHESLEIADFFFSVIGSYRVLVFRFILVISFIVFRFNLGDRNPTISILNKLLAMRMKIFISSLLLNLEP